MANYIVSDTNLTAVANAIRTKGGTSEQLEFPDDFVSAIGDIQTGGGSSVTVEALSVTENGTYTAPTGKAYSPISVSVSGGGTDELLLLETNQLTARTSASTLVRQYLYYYCTSLTSVSYPNATSIDSCAFYNCSSLTSVSFPAAMSVGNSSFHDCSSLTSASFPAVTYIASNAFYNCTNLTSASFPVVTSISSNAFYNCSKLTSITLNSSFSGSGQSYMFASCVSLSEFDWKNGKSIASNMFSGCKNLNVLVLRKSDAICTLSYTSAFNNTPFASNGTGGTLYVPQALIASYQSASNWKTILGYANNQIKAIEGSIYE